MGQRKQQPWLICLLASFFAFYAFFQMSMLNSLNIYLTDAFFLSPNQMGYLSASYLYTDAIFLVPAGILLDIFSTKKLILITLSIMVVGTFLFSIGSSFLSLLLARTLVAVGHSFALLSCFSLVMQWIPSKSQGFAIGLVMTIALLGGAFAQAPFGFLLYHIGWRHACIVDGIIGFLLLYFIWKYVKDGRDCLHTVSAKKNTTIKKLVINLRVSVSNLQNWLSASYIILLNFPLVLLGSVWGIDYLVKTYKLSTTNASFCTAMLFFGMMLGSPLMGWLSDYVNRRKSILMLGVVLSLFSISFLVFFKTLSVPVVFLLFFMVGFFSSAQSLAYVVIVESNKKFVTGTAMSITNVVVMLGLASAQLLFGLFLDVSGANYHAAMLIFPAAFLLAIIFVCFMKESFSHVI